MTSCPVTSNLVKLIGKNVHYTVDKTENVDKRYSVWKENNFYSIKVESCHS